MTDTSDFELRQRMLAELRRITEAEGKPPGKEDLNKAKELVDKTQLKAFAFLPAIDLVEIVAMKLEAPEAWSDDRLRSVFRETRIVGSKHA